MEYHLPHLTCPHPVVDFKIQINCHTQHNANVSQMAILFRNGGDKTNKWGPVGHSTPAPPQPREHLPSSHSSALQPLALLLLLQEGKSLVIILIFWDSFEICTVRLFFFFFGLTPNLIPITTSKRLIY